MNLSLDELLDIKIILKYINCSDSQIPRNKSLFNQHDRSLARNVIAASQVVFTKHEPIRSEHLYEY